MSVVVEWHSLSSANHARRWRKPIKDRSDTNLVAFTLPRSVLTEISQGQSNPPLFPSLEDGVKGGTKGVCRRVMLQRGRWIAHSLADGTLEAGRHLSPLQLAHA